MQRGNTRVMLFITFYLTCLLIVFILYQHKNNYHQHMNRVLYFSAAWCGPCKSMKPIFEKVSTELNGKHEFVKIDADTMSEQDVAKYNIRSIPTIVVENAEGALIARKVGVLTEQELIDLSNTQL